MSAQTAVASKLQYPLPVPEQGLTAETVLARAAALRQTIRATQDEDDARGYHSEALDKEFRKAGFYHMLQPRMFGGYEFDYVVFFRTMLEIARANPGVGWCLTLASTHGLLIASHWPERAQFEAFGATGEFRSPHRVGMTSSTCVRGDGGYIVDGSWNYCSGIPYATHFVGNVLLKEDGKPPVAKIFCVPKSQVTMLNDWGGEATLGMRASGSNSVRLDKVFVPDYFVIDAKPALWSAEPIADGTTGWKLHRNPIYLGRLIAPYHMSLVLTAVGAARAACDEFEEGVLPRPTYHPPIVPRYQHFDSQRPFGYAMTLADSAEALLVSCAQRQMDLYHRWAKDGTEFTLEDLVRTYAMVQQAGRLACEAVEHLFHNASSFSAKKGQKLERYFRDVSMYRSHMSAQYLNIASGISRVHSGLPFGWGGL